MDLSKLNLQELSTKEKKEIQGGFFFGLIGSLVAACSFIQTVVSKHFG